MKTLRRHFLAACFVLALAGCGGSGDDGGADIVAADAADTVEQTIEASESTASADSETPQSLDEYLGLAANLVRGGGRGGGLGDVDQDEVLEQQRLVQQSIQVCMQEQGFTYVPEDVGVGLQFALRNQGANLSAVEYAETEGFGISTQFDALLEGDIDLSEATADPNDEHLATLSEGEADAWQFALRGAPPERNDQGQLIDPETGEVIQGRGRPTGGCNLVAQEEVRGDVAALSELADSFDELEDRIAADPRISELAREWTTCMGEAGFDFQDEGEARAAINDEFRPLARSFFQGQRGDGEGAGPGQGGGNRLQAIAGLELSAEQEAELSALQDRERAMAVASLECHGDSQTEIDEIEATYEAEYVEANRDALEAFAS